MTYSDCQSDETQAPIFYRGRAWLRTQFVIALGVCVIGDYRNKARKLEATARIADAEDRRKNGWVVFRYDYHVPFTRSDMSLGEAIRYLCKISGRRISWWRCPVRGLSIEYKILPTTNKAYDKGEVYRGLSFSDHADEIEAKKQLVIDTLLRGMGDFRRSFEPMS